MIDDITLVNYQLYISPFILNLGTNCSNQIHMGSLTKIHIHLITCHEAFYYDAIFFAWGAPF